MARRQKALETAFGNGLTERWWEGPQTRDQDDSGRPVKGREARSEHAFRTISEWGTLADGVPRVLQREMQGVPRPTVYPRFLTKLEDPVDPAPLRQEFPELADVPNDQLPPYFKK